MSCIKLSAGNNVAVEQEEEFVFFEYHGDGVDVHFLFDADQAKEIGFSFVEESTLARNRVGPTS